MYQRGIIHALGAYIFWGLVPIYWKLLKPIPATQLIGHRIVWSFLLLVLILSANRKWRELHAPVSDRKVLFIYSAAALLCGVNWFIYVWAVTSGHIVEASLGYFVNPLLSVLLGVILLRERLRRIQWYAISLAAVGVIYLASIHGRLPWIALSLAVTFGFYGLVKKLAPLKSATGLTLETGILFVPGLLFLAFEDFAGRGAFLHVGVKADLLMVGAGMITTVPLLLFASAAQRIPLTTIGIMQYITPTLQFLLGVLIYKEPFSFSQSVGFGIVWIALIVFCVESFLGQRALPVRAAPEPGGG